MSTSAVVKPQGKTIVILHKKTLAVSTAALVISGGAAYAFIAANSVSGGGAVQTKQVTAGVVLSLENGVQLDPLNSTQPQVAKVFAANSTNSSLSLPSIVASIDTTGFPVDCPADSFGVTYTSSQTLVPPQNPGFEVGSVTVTYTDKPLVDQAGCNGLPLTVKFAAAPAPIVP